MAKFGNTNVSSLLRASQAAMNKRVSLEDSIAAYEYDLSPKDQGAYQKYADYLNNRLGQFGSDPSKQLNYQKLLTTANRGFTSTEISRASTQILYGSQSPQDKLNTIVGLYQRALQNGDENLAQRLEGQAASLQQTIMSAGRGGGGGGFGGGGGGGSDTAQKKGIDEQLKNVDEALREIDLDLSKGKISREDYMAQKSKLYDAKNNILSNTYTTDPSGNIVPGGGLSSSQAQDYFNKHLEFQNNNDVQKYMANNSNIPLETRLARAHTFFDTTFDPLTGQTKTVDPHIVGWRPLTELGSNVTGAVTDLNPDNNAYKSGFEKVGLPGLASKVQNGVAQNVGYIDPSTQKQAQGDVYLNDKDNAKYAYIQDQSGARLAVLPNGNVSIMPDSVEANRQVGDLKNQLAAGKITQDQYNKAVQGIDTNYVGQGILANNKAGGPNVLGIKQSTADQIGTIANKFVSAGDEIGKKVIDPAFNAVGDYFHNEFINKPAQVSKLLQDKNLRDIYNKAAGIAQGLGIKFNPSGFGGNSQFGAMNFLQTKLKDLQTQKAAKDAADAERARQDAIAMQQQIAQARQQINSTPAGKPKSVVWQPQPAQQNTVAQITNAITRDPFSQAGIGTNSLYRL